MSFAVIVLAHKGPDQVKRLAQTLAPNPVFVHVDSAADEYTWSQFQTLLDGMEQVTLMPRRRTAWASWALVEAALDGVSRALAETDSSHVLLLSGQDYPLASPERIAEFLDANQQVSFFPHWRLPSTIWGRRRGMDRVSDYNFRVFGRRLRIRGRRRIPDGLVLVGGSMYWILDRGSAHALLEVKEQHPEWVKFLAGCWIPDELAIPSLLHSVSRPLRIINENLVFIRWSSRESAHPDTLRYADRQQLAEAAADPSGIGGQARFKLFARKFDWDVDPALGDWIDTNLIETYRIADER